MITSFTHNLSAVNIDKEFLKNYWNEDSRYAKLDSNF